MKIKKGDTVQVISGKDKGKKGKVILTFSRRDRLQVEGVNKVIRHTRPKREGEKGQRVEISAPIHVSNVMLICPKCGKPTRVGYKVLEKGKKKRVCKKCGEVIK